MVIVAWGQILTTVKMINQLGVSNADGRQVHRGDQRVQGPAGPRSAEPECGKYPTEPAACNDQTQFFQYKGTGNFKRITGFLRPPETFTLRG